MTSATSRFRPLHVPSDCMWSPSLNDKCHFTILASSCAIRLYVVSLFEGQVPPHNFGLFVCHQGVRDLAHWRTSATSWFRPHRVPSDSTWSRSLKDKCHLMILAFSCAIRLYVISLFEGQMLPHDFGFFVCHQTVRDLALWRTNAASRFRLLRVPSDCTWSCSLKDKCHLMISAFSCAISMYVISLFEKQVPPHDFGLVVCHQYVHDLPLWRTSATSRFWPLHVPSGCTWSRSLKDKWHLTISASSCAIRLYVISLIEGQVPPHNFGFFVCHQSVRDLAHWRTSATSRFWPLCVSSVCTWSRSLKDKCHLMILASLCVISMYVISLIEGQVPPHNFGLFVCHQYVCDLSLWRTNATSQFWPLRVPSGCMWSRHCRTSATSRFRSLRGPLGSTWFRSLKEKCHLTISASSCAIRLYVVSLFERPVPPHNFGLFVCHQFVCDLSLKEKCHLTISASSCAISMYVISLFEGQVPPHDFDLFVCHQYVCDLALCVPSGSTWSRSLKDKCYLTILTSSCAISLYVISLIEGQVPPYDFGLFVCHQSVCDLALWRTSATSWFYPHHVPLES